MIYESYPSPKALGILKIFAVIICINRTLGLRKEFPSFLVFRRKVLLCIFASGYLVSSFSYVLTFTFPGVDVITDLTLFELSL